MPDEIMVIEGEASEEEIEELTDLVEGRLIMASGSLSLGGVGEDRDTFRARFVKAGRIKAQGNRESNIIVEPGALIDAQASGKFDAKAVFIDHAGFFQYPSMRDLAGVTFDSRWNESTQSVDGSISFYSQAEPVVELIREMLDDGKDAPDVGLSLVFWPRWAPRDSVEDPRRIIGITHIESVDLVFEPAADGRLIEALSVAFQMAKESDNGGTEMPDEIINEVEEETLSPDPEPVQEEPTIVQQARDWNDALSVSVSATMFANSGLPAASIERLSTQSFDTPAAVEAAIEQERSFLARLEEDNVVTIGGDAPRGANIQMGLNALDKITLAADALLTGLRPDKDVAPLSGIRELYMLLSGDYDLTGIFHADRVQFANVNSATMAGLVANALNKRIVNLFQEYPQWWAPIVSQEDFGNLQDVRWITLGG
ncbi:MAG: hypothetical protein KAI94_11575, partial [Anaerolineales bacterium]|nr:hypothetical protein [Anaerolineales bacterium]